MQHSLDDLEAFARQFNTDKQAGQNEYLALYLEYFQRQGIERSAPLEILEIGTNKGSSLRTWAEYFPNATVHGVDITRQYEIAELLDHPRIITHIVNAGNGEDLESAVLDRDFDIIIDDGSHEQTDQQVALGVLFYYLKPGGLYVVEDLITGENWWDANTYNKARVTPTRNIMKLLEAGAQVDRVEAIPQEQWVDFLDAMTYCEYREAPSIIYGQHHPQIGFIGKKNG